MFTGGTGVEVTDVAICIGTEIGTLTGGGIDGKALGGLSTLFCDARSLAIEVGDSKPN